MIIEGKLIAGLGKASKAMALCIEGYEQILGEPIFPGTFNIELKKSLYFLNPTILRTNGTKFWKIKIIKPKEVDVWIYKQGGSVMPDNQLQILSKYQLRSYLGVNTSQVVTMEINSSFMR